MGPPLGMTLSTPALPVFIVAIHMHYFFDKIVKKNELDKFIFSNNEMHR